MKKIYILLLGAIMTFGACENAIDIEQPGRLSADIAFQSVDDLQLGVLGVYDNFDYTPAISFNSVFTDQIRIGFDNGGQGIATEYNFVLNPQSAISTALWTNYYGALNASTRVIEAAAAITPEAEEQDDYNNILGQTHALRAWAHFELLTYFSTDLTDDNAPGTIILNFIPSLADELPRNTTGEVFAVIESDLSQAEALLTTQSDPTFISLDFVTALRARIAAYRGNYTQADQFAASLLANYSLADTDQYSAMFLDEDNTEIIFKLERAIGDNYDGQGATGSAFAGGWAGANFAFVNSSVDGSPYYEMSTSLFNVIDPADVRFAVNIDPTADFVNNILPIGKYPGSSGQPLMNDLKVFRASEMMLIRAEAAADANDLTGAANFIDQIRDARFGSDQTAPTYATQAEAFAGILNERNIELAYEGFRWVDLKRLGARAGLTGINRDAGDCAVNGACFLGINDDRLRALPIPLVELDANSNIQQNLNY
ncbi:MAG: RagB/SusD family nutrient uptake outer membrane protein [Bacteroidota bacterium]